jgi:sigma-B regulation protein RsbU (phosphoserine phosphatase)
MASAHSLLKAQALTDPQPTRVISQVNQFLADKAHDVMFVTAFYGVYNTATHTLRFTNAGHPPGLLYRPSTTSCASLCTHNLPLGILAPAPFETTAMSLAPGDRLLLYTDGISDAVNARGERFGGPRIVVCLQDHDAGSLNILQNAIMQRVKTFTAGQDQQDDMTVLIVQV